MALLREASPLGLPRESQALAELIKVFRSASRASPVRAGDFNFGRRPLRRTRRRANAKKTPRRFPRRRNAGFDAPTGGYLLQAAFSTGFAAGQGAARYLGLPRERNTPPSPALSASDRGHRAWRAVWLARARIRRSDWVRALGEGFVKLIKMTIAPSSSAR